MVKLSPLRSPMQCTMPGRSMMISRPFIRTLLAAIPQQNPSRARRGTKRMATSSLDPKFHPRSVASSLICRIALWISIRCLLRLMMKHCAVFPFSMPEQQPSYQPCQCCASQRSWVHTSKTKVDMRQLGFPMIVPFPPWLFLTQFGFLNMFFLLLLFLWLWNLCNLAGNTIQWVCWSICPGDHGRGKPTLWLWKGQVHGMSSGLVDIGSRYPDHVWLHWRHLCIHWQGDYWLHAGDPDLCQRKETEQLQNLLPHGHDWARWNMDHQEGGVWEQHIVLHLSCTVFCLGIYVYTFHCVPTDLFIIIMFTVIHFMVLMTSFSKNIWCPKSYLEGPQHHVLHLEGRFEHKVHPIPSGKAPSSSNCLELQGRQSVVALEVEPEWAAATAGCGDDDPGHNHSCWESFHVAVVGPLDISWKFHQILNDI